MFESEPANEARPLFEWNRKKPRAVARMELNQCRRMKYRTKAGSALRFARTVMPAATDYETKKATDSL